MSINLADGELRIDVVDIFKELKEKEKAELLEIYTFEEIIEAIERQLKHETARYAWDTSGYRDGARLRDAILNIQGLDLGFKEDLESRIKALEHDVEHYKKYYDWYFKAYHYSFCDLEKLRSRIGLPE